MDKRTEKWIRIRLSEAIFFAMDARVYLATAADRVKRATEAIRAERAKKAPANG